MKNHEETDLLPWILSATVMLIMGVAVASYSDESDAANSGPNQASASAPMRSESVGYNAGGPT